MKHIKNWVSVALFVLIMAAMGIQGFAEGIVPFADDVFQTASVSLNAEKMATFTATTMESVSSISVTSCTLEKKNGTKWEAVKSLAVPDTEATNTVTYRSTKSYASAIPSGGPYRIVAVFDADGHTITKNSASRSF